MTNPNSSPTLDEHTAAHVAELFRSFSDTSRVRIVYVLVRKEMNVGALRQMGLVVAQRDGKEVYYRIQDEHIIALFGQGVNHVQQG
jgi:DNA-binding transcriptional ArsR family regulator